MGTIPIMNSKILNKLNLGSDLFSKIEIFLDIYFCKFHYYYY